MRRLNSPYLQVAATYMRRPAFRFMALAVLVFWFVPWVIDLYQFSLLLHWYILSPFTNLILALSPPFLLVAIAALLMSHLRQQLTDWRVALVPDFPKPHLRVGFTAFGLVALIASWAFYACIAPERTSFPGILAIGLTMMTLAAWWSLLQSPLFSLLLVPLAFIALSSSRPAASFLDSLIDSQPAHVKNRPWLLPPPWMFPTVRWLLLIANILALFALSRRQLQTSRERTRTRVGPVGRPLGQRESGDRTISRPHRILRGRGERARHRRLASFGRGAPWVVGGALAAILLLLPLLPVESFLAAHPGPLPSFVPITIVPAVAVGLMWHERTPSFGYESLYPARRSDFALELAIALALDVAEFWFAGVLAVVLATAVWQPWTLATPLLRASLLASAMMQCLTLGGLLWVARSRTAGVGLGALAMLLVLVSTPLAFAWPPHPALNVQGLLLVALIELAAGLLLIVTGYVAWQRADLA